MTTDVQQFEAHLPAFLSQFALALRAGYSVGQIVEGLGTEMPEPIVQALRQVDAEVKAGMPLADAFDHWLARTPHEALNLFVATLKAQRQTGGNLADKLDWLGQILPYRQKIV